MEGIIIKNQSNDYTVRTSNGLYVCKPRGKFRNDKITPLVGDSVIIDDINNYLLEILPRKNSLIRPPIANIDIALIAVSVKEPNFDSNLLDKLLTIISFNNIEPVICLTKLDLLTEEERNEIDKITSYYQRIGYIVTDNNNIKEITVDGNSVTKSKTDEDTYEYTLDKVTSKVTIGAIAEAESSMVGINTFEKEQEATYQDIKMEGRSIVVNIYVTAEDGTTKTYKLIVYALPDNVNLLHVKVNGKDATAVPVNKYQTKVEHVGVERGIAVDQPLIL